jgi:diguanylate cyclase (GGDEF)-like protein/PAS domain S-box-containing protein
MLLVGLLAMRVLRRMFAPLAHLTTAAEKITAGERNIHLQKDGGGEIGTLNNTLGIMLDKLSRRELEILRLNEELEQRYRTLFDNMLDGYAHFKMLFEGEVASDYIHIETNSAFEELTGLKHAAGKRISELIPGLRESSPELFERYGRVALTGKPERFETYVSPLQAWFSVTAYSPQKEHVVVIFDNITKEKTAQEEIASLLYRNKVLMQTSMDGIHIMDGEGNILEANDAFCRMLGYTQEEVMHLNVADWDAQWTGDELRVNFKKLIGESAVIETLHRRKDGTLINVEICATGVYTSKGPIFFAASRDITERKQAEAVMLQHQLVIKTSIDGFWMTDMTGKLLEANQAYADMSGYSIEELLDMRITQLEAKEQPAETEAHIAKIVARGSDRFETRHRHKDGHELDIEISANYLPEMQRIAVFCNDITERKQAEKTIENTLLFQQELMNAIPSPVFYKNADCVYIGGNKAFEQYMGMQPEQFIGKTVYDIAPADLAEKYDKADKELLNNPGKQSYEASVIYSDGTRHDVIFNKATFKNSAGEVSGIIGVILDITERKQIEETLRVAAITFETNDAIMITDADAHVIRVNRAFTDITGYAPEEVLGKNPSMMNSGRHDKTFYTEMWQQLLHHGAWSGEIWDRRKSGQVYPKWLNITAVKDEAGEATRYVAIFSDITARKQAEEEIRNLAFYDTLTHLPNRRLFLDRFRAALPISARRNTYGALMFIDMDKFKMINDTLGHDYGDMLLIEVASRIKQCVREMDTVARLGGDEFTVLIEGVSKDKDDTSRKVGMVAEKIRESLAQPYRLKEHLHHSSPSIGVSLFRGEEEAVDVLLRHADMAMYQVKEAGRNAVRFYDPAMQQMVTAHAAMENDLRDAVVRGQLHLYFQMQVDGDKHPSGAEALLRWIHPQRGMVMPDEFISIAEEGTLIIEIGNWVLDTACQQLARWAESARTRDLTLAINVSAKQFAMADYVSNVASIIRKNRINPARLKLELTEGMVLANLAATVEKMHALKALGVRLSIDDFGTGYSSLSYLKLLPIDQLKIDPSFVKGMISDPNDAVLVHAIIELANNFHLNVIAEGVETEAQQSFLKDNHCMEYQGFLFGKAVPIEEFEALLGAGD